jgi:NAD-dependent deacetylase
MNRPRVAPHSSFPPLEIKPGEKIFILTGAGISAESGMKTFRDTGGLWENQRVEDVATPEGWARNPELVWRFYSERRKQLGEVKPNPAHLALAALEQKAQLFLVTQNVDDLHERGGRAGLRRVPPGHRR